MGLEGSLDKYSHIRLPKDTQLGQQTKKRIDLFSKWCLPKNKFPGLKERNAQHCYGGKFELSRIRVIILVNCDDKRTSALKEELRRYLWKEFGHTGKP